MPAASETEIEIEIDDRRIILSINGWKYATFESTLNRFPDTLLGNVNERAKYFNQVRLSNG